MDLQLLHNKEIDYNKWNRLVERYSEGLPYAYSWYLDAVCSEWYAYIIDDYKEGFPLQINCKWGLTYSLQPFMTQQVGFLGKNNEAFDIILKEIEQQVFYYYYQLFFFNVTHQVDVEVRNNYQMSLKDTYDNLKLKFKTNTKRNIKKAETFESKIIISETSGREDLDFIFNNSVVDYNESQRDKIKKLLCNAEKNKALKIYKSVLNKEIVSINVYIVNSKRAVYLLSAQNDLGKQSKASFLLVNRFIQDYSGTPIILDFEGSNIEGVARFYRGFGAEKITYQAIKKKSLKKSYRKNCFFKPRILSSN